MTAMVGTPLLEQYYNSDPQSLSTTHSFVKLARRKRSTIRRNSLTNKPTLKTQGRPLAAQTRVRFTLVENLSSLYNELVPSPARRPIEILKISNDKIEDSLKELQEFEKLKLQIKPLLFIDNIASRQQNLESYNTIDEAIDQLFDLTEYTLLRITRAAATEPGGTMLLKIESAMPGDKHLNDDEYDDNEVVTNDTILGEPGDRPSTTFLKKKVARPRYKSDMRIYLLPRIANVVMYLEERMLKRDLLKGILDLSKDERTILCAFDPNPVLSEVNSVELQRSSISSPFSLTLPHSASSTTSLSSTSSFLNQQAEDIIQQLPMLEQRTLPPIPQQQQQQQSQDPLLQYYSLLQQLPLPPVGQQFGLQGSSNLAYNNNNFFHPQQLQQDIYGAGIFNSFSFGSGGSNGSL